MQGAKGQGIEIKYMCSDAIGHIFLVYLRMRGCSAVQPYACAGKCI